MEELETGKAFTLLEPGPVVLVATNDGKKGNIMTISWAMVIDIIKKHNIVILEAVSEHFDTSRKEKRTLHAIGDGTFIGSTRGTSLKSKRLQASLPSSPRMSLPLLPRSRVALAPPGSR